ncbi:hypothetical protein HYC85_019823 [Camellia sinensis]|uniref:Large ribosomal subunit protein uL18 C-terminal eukaryotes domain-containing protein n=1 Tax=Camellia sinensis TaxID=4442 RepID=A0A7J7GQJ9_CAMSI|nr:hypothetical protein HYC85_019823 [Camellia sinensis]
MVLASAYAHELPRYGLEVGLTNYAAVLIPVTDVGSLLYRIALGPPCLENARDGLGVWAMWSAILSLQGALDGGLDIPHSDKRFSGFSKDSKQLDAEVHSKYIYGGHVAAYMKILMEDEPEKYQSHFVEYIKRGIEPDGIEELYKKVHAAIHADPTQKKSEKEPPKQHKRYNLKKLTYDERKASLIEQLNALNAAAGADEEVDDEDAE